MPIAFNRLNVSDMMPLPSRQRTRLNVCITQTSQNAPDPAIFEDENFEEALRFLEFELRLFRVEDGSASTPSSCSSRPTLHFVGSVSGNAHVKGRVYMTPDEQVRWSFVRPSRRFSQRSY